ncbi:hypothetical protein [Haloglomus litoreum]|nr:hypothetical protein [Haloglomus sp. DT116]
MHRSDRPTPLAASAPYWTAEVVSWFALLLVVLLFVLLSAGVVR